MNLLIKFFLLLIVVALAVFLFAWSVDSSNGLISESILNEEEDAHEDDDDAKERVFIVDGYKAVQLEKEVILASGLEFSQLEEMSFKPEFTAYAEVVSVEPLVALKTEYQTILAEKKILQNKLNNQNKILKRAEVLHKAKSLSTRDLEKNHADRDLKATQLNAINTRLDSFMYRTKSLWGNALAGFVVDEEKQAEFNDFASYKTLLILLSLPKNKTLTNQQQKVFVNNRNERETALSTLYFDQARHVNNPLYGESYLYLLNSEKLRAGMRLFAWVAEAGESLEGSFVPESAVIWYANQPWIYLQRGEDLFVRKPLANAKKLNKGWLLKNTSFVGEDSVVTRGGQTLLSEEFKWAIPDEDDD